MFSMQDATMFMANVKATICTAGPGRVAALLKSACKLHGCAVPGAVRKLTRFVEGAVFPSGEYHVEVAALARKYRALYDTSSLKDGFGIPHGKGQQERMLRDVLFQGRLFHDSGKHLHHR